VYWFYQGHPSLPPEYAISPDSVVALGPVNQLNAGLLILRAVFGLFLSFHGLNKFFASGGLDGTARWFEGIGMRWPRWQARLAATTEVGSGVLMALGFLTPLAAAGMIGVMTVAIVVAHWKVGFFIFKPNQGWEYCASIAVTALVIAMIGPGRWSIDHAAGINWHGWTGALIAAVAGVVGAMTQLAISYRPKKDA
jgi:putative oxidoreductase